MQLYWTIVFAVLLGNFYGDILQAVWLILHETTCGQTFLWRSINLEMRSVILIRNALENISRHKNSRLAYIFRHTCSAAQLKSGRDGVEQNISIFSQV